MVAKPKKSVYIRVSTSGQSIENQRRAFKRSHPARLDHRRRVRRPRPYPAARPGQRPEFAKLLQSRIAWCVSILSLHGASIGSGRSLAHLLEFINDFKSNTSASTCTSKTSTHQLPP